MTPSSVQSIDISNNHLNELTTASLKHNRKIINLFLTGNQLTEMPMDILSSLQYLEEVQLDYNKLKKFSHPTLFRTNKYVLSIQMNHNNINFLHNDIFVPLQKLERIDLSANQIQNISDKLFRKNSKLEKIRFSNNSIKLIEKSAFTSLPKLEELYLDNNRLAIIPEGLFSNNKQLRVLVLSKNEIGSINEESFAEDSNLEELLLDNNKISYFRYFSSDVLKNLKILNLANNHLLGMNQQLINLKSLTHLFLQNNQLKTLKYLFQNIRTNLTTLNCSNNQITELNLMQISYYTKLRTIDLSDNPIFVIKNEEELMENIFTNLQFQHDIDVNANLYIWGSILNGHVIKAVATLRRMHMTIPTLHVHQYDLVLIIVHCKVKEITCHEQPITAVLDLSHNHLLTIECVANMTKLNILNLTHNHLQTLSASRFASHAHLKQLDTSSNGMIVHLRHFKESKQLSTLSFSNNTIDWSWSLYLIPHLFPKLKNISMNDINVYCPLLETIFFNFTAMNITVEGYDATLELAELSVGGISCVNYHFLKYLVLDASFCVVMFMIILLICIIHMRRVY